ncbi:MAG: prolyl oligopeptidase family serine peptidase [Acidobacteriota bacterium]|nr:prolyl oligopeptidase family serine peptidase [Acidobacteriota bacterium]
MTSVPCAFVLSPLIHFVTAAYAQQGPQFPPTTKKPVRDEYHGITVIDDYRWLEDSSDPEVGRWVSAQNQLSRSVLDNFPGRALLAERLNNLYSARSVFYYDFYQRRMFFALKSQPAKNQPLLVMLKSPDDLASEQVVLDPNLLNPKGTTAIGFYVPSLDGHLVAVSLSENGSEDGSVEVFASATGRKLPDLVPRVRYATAGGSVAWNKDATGFYYTRYPQGNERPKEDINFYQQVYFHKLGTPGSEDTYVIGKDFPRIAEITLSTSEDAGYLMVSVANGDGGEFAHYLLGPSGTWKQITQFSDQIKSASFGLNGMLYLLSIRGSPKGKILSAPLDHPSLARAKTIVPESKVTIEGFLPARNKLYVSEMAGGPSEVRIFDLYGKREGSIPTRPVSSVNLGAWLHEDEILFGSQSYVEPFSWYRFNPVGRKVTRTGLAGASAVNFNDAQVVRAFATSRDGTRVPLNIISRKGTKLNGQNPTILYGYGGYNVSLAPSFIRRNRLWLDAGGVYVEANLRGGGEYGEEWHKAGALTNKQNVFDDFAACARYLIDKKYTSAARLAIEGGSNGGLLMGAALTQHPELFRAVVSYAGWYDMLRVEVSPNGAFNVTELGTVKDPDQFRALYAYSPYHHVKDHTAYPAVLFITGDNDVRVEPWHSRKMTARLQAATSSHLPILLRTSSDTGHGTGSGRAARIAQETDVLAFLFDQLEINQGISGKQ